MALARGIYGIEYTPKPVREGSRGLGWLVLLVVVAALVSLGWTLFARHRATRREDPEKAAVATRIEAPVASSPASSTNVFADTLSRPLAPSQGELLRRPAVVRNLLLRLEAAEARKDVEMAVSTIESLRDLPGEAAADLDNALAHRLGDLNIRRLFFLKHGRWVKTVTVRPGATASRIADENGSTLASFRRLNGASADRLRKGEKVYVMDHPRFNLIVRRRSRSADLQLNGKFFKRYDLSDEVSLTQGQYAFAEGDRSFWKKSYRAFKPADRLELETLLPRGATVLVTEI